MNRPTTPSERAAAEARRLAQLRAARAAEISRRKAAAKRRLVLTVVLVLASVGGWLGFGLSTLPVALGVVPTVLLLGVLVLGRRAAKIAARRNAADRAAMARLEVRPASRTRPASSARPATTTAGSSAAPATESAAATEPVEARAPASAEPVAETAGPAVVEETEPAAPAEQPAARSWTPVQVPVPTYTLKASAPRRDIAPYEAPQAEPVVEQAPAEPAAPAEPVVVVSGLAGSPYAPVADPEPEAAPAAEALPARGLDLDSVLARRRAVGA